MVIINRIRELRQQKGYSQQTLADLLFVNQTAVSQWEREVTFPEQPMLIKLASLFNVSTDYILGIPDNKKPPESEDVERLKEVLANVDVKTREAIELLDQLTPDNLERAKEYIRFELARQGDAGDKR